MHAYAHTLFSRIFSRFLSLAPSPSPSLCASTRLVCFQASLLKKMIRPAPAEFQGPSGLFRVHTRGDRDEPELVARHRSSSAGLGPPAGPMTRRIQFPKKQSWHPCFPYDRFAGKTRQIRDCSFFFLNTISFCGRTASGCTAGWGRRVDSFNARVASLFDEDYSAEQLRHALLFSRILRGQVLSLFQNALTYTAPV